MMQDTERERGLDPDFRTISKKACSQVITITAMFVDTFLMCQTPFASTQLPLYLMSSHNHPTICAWALDRKLGFTILLSLSRENIVEHAYTCRKCLHTHTHTHTHTRTYTRAHSCNTTFTSKLWMSKPKLLSKTIDG